MRKQNNLYFYLGQQRRREKKKITVMSLFVQINLYGNRFGSKSRAFFKAFAKIKIKNKQIVWYFVR